MTHPQANMAAAPASVDLSAARRRSGWRRPPSWRCWRCTSSASTRARLGVRQRHPRARVRARRTAPARLPLPLTAGVPTVEKRIIGRGLAGRRPRLACWRSFSPASSSSPSSVARSPLRTVAPTPRMRGGVHEHGAELFTRGVQANIGLGFGVLAFGVAMGALFAVVFCVAYGARRKSSSRRRLVAAAGGRRHVLVAVRGAVR